MGAALTGIKKVEATGVPAAQGTAQASTPADVKEEGASTSAPVDAEAPQTGGRRNKRRNVKRRTLRKKRGSRRCK